MSKKSQNPERVPAPKPMTTEELIAWHKENGTLRPFLKDYSRER
jgi:hypothetical protein